MVNRILGGCVCFVASMLLGTASAATISNLSASGTGSLALSGTNAAFHFHTGPGKGGKALASQEYIVNGVAQGSTSVNYVSSPYSYSFSTGIAAGSTVTSATLDFASLVQQALVLSAPALDTVNSSSPGCPGGLVTSGSGNCRADPLTVGVGSSAFYLKSIQIGTASYIWSGAGTPVSSLGQVNLATLNVNFLSQLGGGQQITITWAQAAALTGYLGTAPGAVLNDNMLCKNCTVYYNVTSSATQNSRLTSTFNAIYNPYVLPQVPEPSTYALMGAGLIGLALLSRRSGRS